MKHATPLSILALGIFISAWPALGHHSFAAEFDSDKPVQVAGAVTKVEWTNPHARFYVDVKDDQGNIVNWNIELGPPLVLHRLGWRHDSLKIGDQVTVEGAQAKDGSQMANARTVILADGKKVFAFSASDAPPPSQ